MFDYSLGYFHVMKRLELVPISRENQPNVYAEGSALALLSEVGGFYTPANLSEIILQNSYEIPGAIQLSLIVKKCDPTNLPNG